MLEFGAVGGGIAVNDRWRGVDSDRTDVKRDGPLQAE